MIHSNLSIQRFSVANVLQLYRMSAFNWNQFLRKVVYALSEDFRDRRPTLQHGLGQVVGHAGRLPQAGGQGMGGDIGGIIGGC